MSNVEMMIAQVCDDAEKIWFYDNIHHYICFSDYNFEKVHIEKAIDLYDIENLGTGIAIFRLKQKLYIIFQRKVAVLVYSIQSKEYYTILYEENVESNLYNIEKNKGNILFFPQKINGKVFIFDMQREKFEQRSWMDKCCIKSGWTAPFLYRENEKIFLPIYDKELLFELNLSDYKYIIHKYEGIPICSICHYEDTTWIAQTDSAELVCIKDQCMKRIDEYAFDSIGGRDFFSKLFVYNGKMIGIPRFSEYVLIVDLKNGKVDHLYHDALKMHKKNTTSFTYGYYCVGHLLYLLPWGTLKLLCVDIEKLVIYEKKIEVYSCDYYKYLYFNPGYENDIYALKDYLNWIVLKDSFEKENEHKENHNKYIGEIIYETMKKEYYKQDI